MWMCICSASLLSLCKCGGFDKCLNLMTTNNMADDADEELSDDDNDDYEID